MATGNFDACMTFVFREEGGFTKDPHDPGNWTGGATGRGVLKGTNFGISAKTYPNEDIAHLTKERAEALYRRDFWHPCGCDDLLTGVDLVIMDVAVNSGVGRGRTYRDATASVPDPGERIDTISDKRRGFYKGLKTFSRYGRIWLGRVARIQAAAIKMALVSAGMSSVAVNAELSARAGRAQAASGKAKATATVAGAASGSTAGATIATAPTPDQAAHPIVFLVLLAVIVAGIAAALLLHRARAQRELASAYAEAAAETN